MGPITDMIFDLIDRFEGDGRLAELLRSAAAFKPDSPKLKNLIAILLPNETPQAVAPVNVGTHPPPQRLPLVFGVESLSRSLRKLAAGVGRIESNGTMATGFLVGTDLFLTCHYAVPSLDGTSINCVRFPQMNGDAWTMDRSVAVAQDWRVSFSPVEYLDYVLIRLAEQVGYDDFNGRPRSWLSLASDRLDMVTNLRQFHYPNGASLSVSFVSSLDGGSQSRLGYEYATSPGSGGAPSINEKLQVVAMHERRSADGLRGEGVHAADILQDLARQGKLLPPGAEE